jgi:hypothetical protein
MTTMPDPTWLHTPNRALADRLEAERRPVKPAATTYDDTPDMCHRRRQQMDDEIASALLED